MKKIYCAFGVHYRDSRGEIVEASENYFIVKAIGYGVFKLAIDKNSIELFETVKERDEWIKAQKYQYDDR